MNSKTIAIFGLFGGGNLGNEATLDATLLGLRARLPDARLVIVSAEPSPLAGLNSYDASAPPEPLPLPPQWWQIGPWRYRKWLRAGLLAAMQPWRRRTLRRVGQGWDMLLVAGTGIADDFYQDPFEVPLSLSDWCSVMKSAGKRVRFASIGAGPVADSRSVRWLRRALRAADYRSYRDRSSLDFAHEIGVDASRDAVAPDLVFSLPLRPEWRRPVGWPPRSVALGVMGYYGWNATDPKERERIYSSYIEKLMALCEGLLARGLDVRLLVGHRRDDRRAVDDLLKSLSAPSPGQGTVTATPIQSYHDVLSEVAAADLVIASRFHNLVLALLLERPAISIEYGKKNSDLMKDVGLEDYCHFIERFDPARVLAQVGDLQASTEPPIVTLRTRLREYRDELDRQFDRLSSFE